METQVNFIDNLHPNIQVGKVSHPRDPQRWAFTVDAPRPDTGYSVHNNSLNNLLRGLNERVFYTDNHRTTPLDTNPEAFRVLQPFEEAFQVGSLCPITKEDFVASYHGSQRSRYQRCYDSLLAEPLNSRDFKVSTFVKCEKIDFLAKHDPAPRVIQPRNPRFNTEIGVFIKPLEKLIYKKLGKLYRYPCVAKGFDNYQTGDILHSKWNLFKKPVAVSLDASRFDQHCSVAALKWTHSIYKKFCSDPHFSFLLSKMLLNKGHASSKDGFVKYWVEGRRMSGDMDTALGNCLLMVAMTYSLCRTLGIDHEVMDNGDDIVVIFEDYEYDRFIEAVPKWYADLGFRMKVEQSVRVLEQIEFCQAHPVYDGEEWRMVRNLRSLSKDLVCCTNQQQVRSWLKAIGDGGKCIAGGMPVLDSFYHWLSKMDNNGKRVKNWLLFSNSGFARMAPKIARRSRRVTPEARESFERAFGMPIDKQLALESVYRGLSQGPLGINQTLFNTLNNIASNSPILF